MRAASTLLFIIALTGCSDGGPKRHEVSGTVTFDGAAIPLGEIQFTGPGLAPDAGKIVDGKFTVQVQPGNKKVEVRASRPNGETEMGPIMKQYIPARYNSETELEVDISGPRPDLEFKLTGQ